MAESLERAGQSSTSELLRRLSAHPIVRNALLLYTVQITGYIFPLIALRYLSRVLSTEHFGIVAYAQSFAWYFVTLTEYGFNLTATRAVATCKDNPEPSPVPACVPLCRRLFPLSTLALSGHAENGLDRSARFHC